MRTVAYRNAIASHATDALAQRPSLSRPGHTAAPKLVTDNLGDQNIETERKEVSRLII